jgi:hypothetical protein
MLIVEKWDEGNAITGYIDGNDTRQPLNDQNSLAALTALAGIRLIFTERG